MEFTEFLELPVETKIHIINKCSPKSYIRFRRTCRVVDEFCEKYRKRLSVFCCPYGDNIELYHDSKNKLNYISLPGVCNPVKIPMTPDNMVKINKALSGFLFRILDLDENYDNGLDYPLNYLLEVVPDLKVNLLVFKNLKAAQVERIVSSKWKIGGVIMYCGLEIRKILKIERIRKMDPLCCKWSKEEKSFTEEDIVQLTRGKKRLLLFPQFLSAFSCLNALKTIAQNWKKDGQFPVWFCMYWLNERSYQDANICGFYSEIIGMEACHLGSFQRPNRNEHEINDIWIREDGTKWQLVTVKRSDLNDQEIEAKFTFEIAETITDFIQKMSAFLYEIYGMRIINKSSLHEACLTENIVTIKKAFVNFILKQLPLP